VLVLVGVVAAATVVTVLAGREYRSLRAEPAPLGRRACTSALDPIAAVLQGRPSDTCERNPGSILPTVRAIVAEPARIQLFAGGRVVRTVATARPVATLDALAGAIHDPGWITSADGRVAVSAAVIARSGLALTVAAPTTTEVTLAVRPGVFLAADRARLRISHVTVQASTRGTPTEGSRRSERASIGRPFISAFNRSTMAVDHSRLLYLGRDWNASYGLSWSTGSTGSVTHSTFSHDFIGVYSLAAHGLRITDNEFHDCSLYGIDPHSGSTGVVVERNLAEGSGRHGIIFSDNVNGGVVRDNVSRGNGLNGIMMDASSTGNLIEGNLVADNRSDGIVMASSPNNRIVRNDVVGNRVGIHVRGSSPTSERIEHNRITGNDVISQGVTSLRGNVVRRNGGQWKPLVIASIWAGALAVLALLSLGTYSTRRRRDQRPAARPGAGATLAQ
jgi:poly(beta-D-mannuronate) C5 epimerase